MFTLRLLFSRETKEMVALLDKIFSEHQIDTVLDFAGLIQVGESVKEPSKYFQNNLGSRN